MVVMATFAFYRIRESKHWAERIFWVAVTVAEGVSRMELNYHTLEQVIAGTAFGIVYALLF
jgi:membrane-associated phospholipid phosphatase